MEFLTAEQVELLAEAIDPRDSTLIRLAAYTGMRAGEIGLSTSAGSTSCTVG